MTSLERFYLVLADALLVLHFSFVAFVVIGFALIWIGWWRRWPWVRNFPFRMSHLAAIGFVAAESLLGLICPLTKWEDRLRLLAGDERRYVGSFVQHWLHRLMFFDVEERVFTIIYVLFFLLVALSLWVVRPCRRQRTV
jgi:hypothetical protein